MFYQAIFKHKRKSVIGLGILFCALLWALTVADQPMPWEERERKREAAKQGISEAEQTLATTTDQARADQLRLRIAELSLRGWAEGPAKSLDHLQYVSDATTDTQRLCSLLWQAARRLQFVRFSSFKWKDADWNRIKPAYERIARLSPDSDVARRALYQLGRYYLVQKDFRGWRENREEFIRRFSESKPFYALVAAEQIGDSFLFEGNVQQAQEQYEKLLRQRSKREEKRLGAEVYLRLLQTSWVKPTSSTKIHAWKQGLTNSLGFGEEKEYDFSAWLNQLLKENQTVAQSVPLSEWSECKELWPYNFVVQFNEGLYDNVFLKHERGSFDWLNKKARTRKKVARVKADLRTIATALEAYYVDHCSGYPPLKLGGLRLLTGVPRQPYFKEHVDGGLTRYLEVPKKTIKYLRLVPLDPFGKKANDFYNYHTHSNTGHDHVRHDGWILISRGPDGSLEIDPPNDYDVLIRHPAPKLVLKAYDPTNGTFSAGDIFRVPQQ